MKKYHGILCFLICMLILLACSSFPTLAASSTTVALNTKSSYLVKGETSTLKVTGTSQKVTWISTNKQIATVSSSGKVTAVAYGTATIKATVNKKTYKCYITVIDLSLIRITPSSTEVVVNGDAVSLNLTSDSYSSKIIKKMKLRYKISGNAGVTVSNTGEVKATEAGNFSITAYVHGRKIETVNMMVVNKAFLGFTDSQITVDVHATKTVDFADKSVYPYYEVEASSSDTNVAKVSKTFSLSDLYNCNGL